ncbi:hypothetical protein D3C78_1034810 [compost metagenome]
MVDDELADAGGAGAVETDTGQIARVGRQHEVAVARRQEGDQQFRLNAQCQPHGGDGGQGGGLAVHQLGDEEEHQGVGPGLGLYHVGQSLFEQRHVGLEEGLTHPGNPEHGEDGDHACLEDGAVGDVARLDLAAHQYDGAGDQHHHLDHQVHGERACLVLDGKDRTQPFVGTEQDHGGDGGEEDPGRPVGLFRELGVEQGFTAAVDEGALLRILDLGLELLVLVQILATAQAPQGRHDHTGQGGGDGDHQDVEQAVSLTYAVTGRQNGDHGDHGNGDRGGADRHLGGNGGHRHRALGTDVLLQRYVGDDGEHGVDHVAGTAQEGEGPGGEGGQNGDVLRVTAQQALGHLHHQVEATGGLQGGGAADHRQYGQHHLHRRFARHQAEHEGQQEETYATDETQSHAPKAGTQQQAAEHHQKFHQDHSITSCD